MLLQHVPSIVFVFCFGACVGSFLNVVVYRLPAGMSVISPPSRCPTCGAHLRFFRENLPILGWLMVRGRCRYCGVRISPQYMIVELMMAILFAGLYIVLYLPDRQSTWAEVGGNWWLVNQFFRTLPAFIVFALLLAGLYAMTVIDARTFTIPGEIPLFIIVAAFILLPIQTLFPTRGNSSMLWPAYGVTWKWFLVGALGMAGVLFASLQLWRGRWKHSFSDYEEFLPEGEGNAPLETGRVTLIEIGYLLPLLVAVPIGVEVGAAQGTAAGIWSFVGCFVFLSVVLTWAGRTWAGLGESDAVPSGESVLAPEYPHARREIGVELRFLMPCIVGCIIGYLLGGLLPTEAPPRMVQAIGGVMVGYLAGGGIVWAIRILGTLIWGREAMGLGDVHLLAAIGAVLGWLPALLVFFLGPFSGILWTLLSIGMSLAFRLPRKELPYGPHLAIAAIALFLCWPIATQVWDGHMPWPLPQPGFVQTKP